MPLPDKKVVPPLRNFNPDSTPQSPTFRENGVEGLGILAHVHNYPPAALTGGAFTLHHFLKYGQGKGWIPKVICDYQPARADSYDGIPVRQDNRVSTIGMDYNTANVVITHLNVTMKAAEISMRKAKPLVHLVHNSRQLDQYHVQPRQCALAIFNTQAVADDVAWGGNQCIVHPRTPVANYETEIQGEAVTMVNMMAAKGAELFFELARRNPGLKFIGVRSTFGTQLPDPGILNLEMVDPVVDMREIFQRTKLVLMPSERETWGRVMVEAACSGIPSLCSDLPGPRENGVADSYLPVNDFDAWNKSLRKLMRGSKAWVEASAVARLQADELDELIVNQLEEAWSKISLLC